MASNTQKNLNSQPEKEISKLLSALLLKTNSDFKNKVFSVGGFVRDQILNIDSNDLDLVIEMQNGAEKFASFLNSQFKNETTTPFQKGLGYPIWTLKFTTDVTYNNLIYKTESGTLDLADSQKECFPDPTTRQRITTYGNLTEDIQRRDFTINMLAENLTTHEILDLSGTGLSDLKAGLIKTHPLNNPDQIFSDDPLRMVRAVRFATKYHFQIHEDVKISIQKNCARLEILSRERIWDELKKMIKNKTSHESIEMLRILKLEPFIFKTLSPLKYSAAELQTADADVVMNLWQLLKSNPLPDVETFLTDLKVETTSKKEVLALMTACLDLDQNSKSWSLAQYRSFFRKHHQILQALIQARPELQSPYQQALITRLQNSPVLNGHQVMQIFGAKGPLIQSILNRALVLEDEISLAEKKDPSDPQLQEQVLEKLKSEFKSATHND